MVNHFKPTLLIVDPITAVYPNAEEKNSETTKSFQQIRPIMKDHECAVIFVHHVKKPSDEGRPALEDVGAKAWLKHARGASTLVNGVDVRIALDYPSASSVGNSDEIAIVFEGYGRIRGTIARTHLAGMFDEEDGEPIGYRVVQPLKSLDSPAQQTAFDLLAKSFTHKQASKQASKKDNVWQGATSNHGFPRQMHQT